MVLACRWMVPREETSAAWLVCWELREFRAKFRHQEFQKTEAIGNELAWPSMRVVPQIVDLAQCSSACLLSVGGIEETMAQLAYQFRVRACTERFGVRNVGAEILEDDVGTLSEDYVDLTRNLLIVVERVRVSIEKYVRNHVGRPSN